MTEVKQTAAGRWSVIAWTRLRLSLVSGLGGFLTIYALAQLGASLATMPLIAPFGATCVLVFAVPQSPLSRPKNVVAGHLVSSLVGLAVLAAIGEGPLSLGIATGLAITMMQASGTLHPPAGADPIVILAGGVSWSFLLTPILVGASVIIVLGWCYHRLVSGRACWGTVTRRLRRHRRHGGDGTVCDGVLRRGAQRRVHTLPGGIHGRGSNSSIRSRRQVPPATRWSRRQPS